jgi:transposase
MQASTVDTPTAGYCGTIFVAIELSQKSWLVTLHSPDRDRISRHKPDATGWTGWSGNAIGKAVRCRRIFWPK